MRILFTGGGSGGHTFPMVAVRQAFGSDPNLSFYYLGPDRFSKKALMGYDIHRRFIVAGKFRRYFSLMNIVDLFKVIIGIIQSFWHLFLWVPDVVFSKGGYGSFPVVFVAWIYRIPVVLHDSDSRPGLANRVVGRFAKKILISFPESSKYFGKKNKIILVGNPIRKELLEGDREEGRQVFGISSDKPVLLVMGGSQGAQKINEIIINTLPRLLDVCEVVHISGKNNYSFVDKNTEKMPGYHLYDFLDLEKLKHAYALSDLIINRAGAGSIFEIAALGRASILIPLPKSASDHQKENAYGFASGGRAVVLDQGNLTQNLFLDQVFDLINDPDKRKEMGEKARGFYRGDSAELIKKEILSLISEK
ncbi:MAG: UDP-N-acetylglucosamine--N-acetylmuramyl-(pentapeptide) pyrophosphoryl-undecaprenol N-acetylglucosamine transferase [Candidatus Portnoybacteria bacterium]|nr:UDP-N-acetylglucosamine--N-acetylmuramyl-(pentapeptide) pyrophosphoryl-undecaprenol N-acetylglucosamine transferase [Candidatus Portnoybacteria bacterium]